MNGTSISAPGLATSSRQASTVNSQLSPMSRNSPLLAGDPANSAMGGAPRSKGPAWPRSRRTRAEPRSASPTAGATPGRLRSPRSSPATGSASSSAIRDGHREDLARDVTPGQAHAITNAVLQAAEQGDHVTPTGPTGHRRSGRQPRDLGARDGDRAGGASLAGQRPRAAERARQPDRHRAALRPRWPRRSALRLPVNGRRRAAAVDAQRISDWLLTCERERTLASEPAGRQFDGESLEHFGPRPARTIPDVQESAHAQPRPTELDGP